MTIFLNIYEWAGYEHLSLINTIHKDSVIDLRIESKKLTGKKY